MHFPRQLSTQPPRDFFGIFCWLFPGSSTPSEQQYDLLGGSKEYDNVVSPCYYNLLRELDLSAWISLQFSVEPCGAWRPCCQLCPPQSDRSGGFLICWPQVCIIDDCHAGTVNYGFPPWYPPLFTCTSDGQCNSCLKITVLINKNNI